MNHRQTRVSKAFKRRLLLLLHLRKKVPDFIGSLVHLSPGGIESINSFLFGRNFVAAPPRLNFTLARRLRRSGPMVCLLRCRRLTGLLASGRGWFASLAVTLQLRPDRACQDMAASFVYALVLLIRYTTGSLTHCPQPVIMKQLSERTLL